MNKNNIQNEIGEWCEETFGPVQTTASVIARANKEMSELLMAPYQNKTTRDLIEEAADVVICLYRYAHLIDEDLDAAIVAKLAKNKTRKWDTDGFGHGQHRRAGQNAGDSDKLLAQESAINGVYQSILSEVRSMPPAIRSIFHAHMNRITNELKSRQGGKIKLSSLSDQQRTDYLNQELCIGGNIITSEMVEEDL